MKMRSFLLILVLALLVSLFAVGCNEAKIEEISAEEEYVYVNPDETKAETDAGFKIDGVLDEAFYKNNNWLYLANKTGGTDVEIAMTSCFGEKGMYFAYDVTEGNPIYVNLDRPSYLNSGIELHLAPSTVSNMKGNSVFEINLLPSGDMTFKKSNGKGNFVNVATTNDIMAVLGTTTKGGELNTADCYGYCMELFIPWEYMEKFDLDTAAMKAGYVYSGLAHITSFNEMGTNMDVDRYWYSFDVQNGASWSNVYQYFRFDKNGIQGTVPVTFTAGEHYKVEGAPAVIPGMPMNVTITPEAGYTITSVLINGEEYIDAVTFNEDGSVTVNERGVAGGVEISAVAQAITEGNKTLTGKVIAHKLGGGSLKNVQASYRGPTGEKLLELDANGKFKLENLKPGNYTIIIEQAGYKKLTRTITVNRDMDVELFLEYDLFAATGDAWILDDQNDGILYKFGGSGELLTNDKYSKFTVSANFKFDKDLVNEGTATVFTEQRQGLKIAFSNGKVWHVDLLKQDGKYYVQYAKHSENALTGWKKVYELTSAEAAKYTSQQGIQLSIQRDGKYANVYLDGKLVSQEVLDSAYAGLTAQIGFEGWAANREVMTVPFKITTSTSVNLRNTFFKMKDGWDVSKQYSGLLIKTSDDVSKMSFLDKYVNMNLTVTARDYADKGNTASRTDILFAFDNGKQISFGIDAGGKQVQSMYGENVGYINTGWKTWGKLTEEEIALLQGEGLAFKVVRYGTEVTLYVNGRMVGVADLTENGSGVTAAMPATVSIRHYEDKGVKIEIPFQVSNTYDKVTVTVDNALATDKAQYFVGDTVKITAKDSNYLVSSLKVNGENVAVSVDGTASFVVTEKEYTVTGEVTKSIFKPDSQWDLTKQFEGLLTIPSRTGNYATVQTTDSTYRDVSVTVRDEVSGTFKMQVYFVFGEGREFQIRLHNENTNGEYRVQKMSTSLVSGWKNLYTLNADEVALLTGTEGITFRVAIVGNKAIALINNVQVGTVDLGSALSATETAKINLIMYGNNNKKNVTIPFTLGAEPKVTTVTVPESTENGTITVNTTSAINGQTITLTATPNGGYNLVDLVVTKDGTPIDLGKIDPDGLTYTWEADGGNYAVTGKFGAKIFQNTEYFDLREQENGSVTLLKGATSARTLKTVSSLYREIAVTVRDQEKGTFKTEFHFVFGEGREFQIRLHNENTNGQYRVQKMSTSLVSGWSNLYTLSNAEVALLKSETGIRFQVTIEGTKAVAYIGGAKVGEVDLTGKITTEMAKIAIVIYGNDGVENIEIPFTLGAGPAVSTVKVADGITNGQVAVNKTACAKGDTITVTATPAEGYNLKSLTVKKNGAAFKTIETQLAGGEYTFEATEEGAYTVEAEFAKPLFELGGTGANYVDDTWDFSNQYAGQLIVDRAGTYAGINTKANTYREVSVTVSDRAPTFAADGKGNFKMQIYFNFADGKKFQIRIDNETANGKNGEYRVVNMGVAANSGGIVTSWNPKYTFTAEQAAKIRTEEGIQFRVAIIGTDAVAYLDNVEVFRVSLAAGITETETAKLQLIMYGNLNQQDMVIPFTLG